MRTFRFGDSEIELVDFEDVGAAERVIEFRYRDGPTVSGFAAVVVPDGGDWSSALLSIDPKFGDVPIAHILSIIDVAREIIKGG